jgi:hypothetical protein
MQNMLKSLSKLKARVAGVVHVRHAFHGSPLREILENDDSGIALVPSSQVLRHVILLERNRKKKKEEENKARQTIHQ